MGTVWFILLLVVVFLVIIYISQVVTLDRMAKRAAKEREEKGLDPTKRE
jgi:hypothetical protein